MENDTQTLEKPVKTTKTKKQPQEDSKPEGMLDVAMDDLSLVAIIDKRAELADAHWNGSPYELNKTREQNQKYYSTDYVKDWVIDERYEDVVADNRMFTSVRTIVPFVTSQITEPEVTAANGDALSKQFAKDFEKILNLHAKDQQAKAKIKVAVQDNLRGQRIGILKWRYDAKRNTIMLEHVDPDSVIIDHRARQHEEPRFLQHTQERTIGDLIKQFPEKEADILSLFELNKEDPDYVAKLEDTKKITENWLFVEDNDEDTLVVCWKYDNHVLAKYKDPNFIHGGNNLLEAPMIPFIFFNFLNDGSSLIDQTSYIEQSQYLQNNYDKRSMAIASNAKYGGIGVPIFAKGALPQGDAAKIQFSPLQRVLLDTNDVRQAFTTWQAGTLQPFVVEDKYDSRNSIDNIWGTPNIMRGEQSKNNTLGQDVLIRDQAEGRQSEIIDAIDVAMARFYKILAQMIYRYFDEDHFYKYVGEDGQFTRLVVNQQKVAEHLGMAISVRAGSSLPVDRAQRRAVALRLAQLNRIGTLRLYEELGLDNADEAYKQWVLEERDPATMLKELGDEVFDREAQEDLAIVIGGEVPKEREDIPDSYLQYLNDYLLTDKFKLLEEQDPEASTRVADFVSAITTKAKVKLAKLEAQQPVPKPGQNDVPPPPVGPDGKPLSPEEAAMQEANNGQPPAPETTAPATPPVQAPAIPTDMAQLSSLGGAPAPVA